MSKSKNKYAEKNSNREIWLSNSVPEITASVPEITAEDITGRKPKSIKPEKRSPKALNFTVPADMYDSLKAKCERLGVSMSALIRIAIADNLKKDD